MSLGEAESLLGQVMANVHIAREEDRSCDSRIATAKSACDLPLPEGLDDCVLRSRLRDQRSRPRCPYIRTRTCPCLQITYK
ncbi:unnamed protein product [Linum trigynum]|uniref:Uncharacterized protein n=1 Tax=Linum trigynum TaxID=586398 RepID=A0AAV2G7F1_9ROSI